MVASLLTAVFLVLVVGISGTTAMWLQAQRERDETQQKYQIAIDAVHASFMRIQHEQLFALPGMTNVRRDLMLMSLPFYRKFVAESGNQPGFRRDLALANAALADIERQAGSIDKALELWEEAREELTALTEESPGNDDYAYHLGRCLREHGHLLHEQGRLEEARQELSAAAERFSVMERPYEKISLIIMFEGFCWQELGEVVAELGDEAEGEPLLRRGVEAMQKLMKINRDDPYFNCQVAECRAVLGQYLLKKNQPEAAVAELEPARDLMESAVEKPFHQKAIGRYYLCKTLGLLGAAYQKLRRPADAEEAMLDAHELLWEFARGSPTVKDYRRDLAENEHNLARLYLNGERFDEAERWCRKALGERKTLADQFPQDADAALKLAKSQAFLKDLIARAGQEEQQPP